MDIFEKCELNPYVNQMKAQGLYPYFHQITGKQHSEVIMDGRRTIMLGSNNYLGLTSDERIIKAGKEAIQKYGSGCSGSRFLNGTLELHVLLEKELKEFFGKQAAITYSTGFQTNLGIISAVAGQRDILIYDKYNHASLIDAARLSGAKLRRYEHNDMRHLERILQNCPDQAGKLIVVDGVFSMKGDLANLPEIVRLKNLYGARLMVDDSHGAGVMGKTGRGTGEHFGLQHEIDLYMATFSKAFASLGGFVAADERIIEYVRHVSRPFIFSASVTPANAAVVLEALQILREEPDRVARVNQNADYMRVNLKRLGIQTIRSEAPIIPIITNEMIGTFEITHELLLDGVYVNPVIPPAIPDGSCLLRTSYMATHTKEQMDYALDKFEKVFIV